MGNRAIDDREREFQAAWLERILRRQAGVVTAAQLHEGGMAPHDIRRRCRRRELRRVHHGVYLTHTGPLTWAQRAWAALLYAAPAALCWDSMEEPRADAGGPIHVAVERGRHLTAPSGVIVHRLAGLAAKQFPGAVPPRLRVEDNALLMVEAADDEIDAIGVLAGVIGRHGVSANHLRRALDRFPRLRRRRWVGSVIADLETGTASVLEHGYLTRVERPHGLPCPTRQAPRRTVSGNEYRDLEYAPYGLVVELDGRLGHGSWAASGRDADRDLDDLALGGAETARLRWRQVYGSPCRTAARIAQVLRRRGWSGTAHRCGDGCDLDQPSR